MRKLKISEILETPFIGEKHIVKGWVRTARKGNRMSFLKMYDGTSILDLQCVCFDKETMKGVTTGCSIEVVGELVESQGGGQDYEIKLDSLKILGSAEDYPIQKKEHTMEFFRENPHLRCRTKLFQSIMKIRSMSSQFIHRYFQEKDVQQFFTPIITSADCEGAGETFKLEDKDFFGKESHLTISGQIELEYGALSLGDVYTFSPTFRAENSHTTKHLSEFWMLERESSFKDMGGMINDATSLLHSLMLYIIYNCKDELDYLDSIYEGHKDKLINIAKLSSYTKMTYKEAIEKVGLVWGDDIDTENEKKLIESNLGKPIVVTNFPSEMKPFYMKECGDSTVGGFDILFPTVGEMVGGSQREDDYETLKSKMVDSGLDLDEYSEYLDTRKYGSVEHSGYGIGFERLIMFLTGAENIRDVIPFPRVPK
jgi:asparaginyl-tRNA synthetase